LEVRGNSPLKFRSPVELTSTLQTITSVRPEVSSLRDAARGVLVDRATAENAGIADALRRYRSD